MNRSVFLETITFPPTRTMSGASRAVLSRWRKGEGILIKNSINKASKGVPTTRKRNNQRLKKTISRYKDGNFSDFWGEMKKGGKNSAWRRNNVAGIVKHQRSILKKSQVDHTIYNYPLIEGVLSGASRAYRKKYRKEQHIIARAIKSGKDGTFIPTKTFKLRKVIPKSKEREKERNKFPNKRYQKNKDRFARGINRFLKNE